MLTVGERTNLCKFIRYIKSAVRAGDRAYWVWKSGPVTDRLRAWVENASVPNVDVSRSSSAPQCRTWR